MARRDRNNRRTRLMALRYDPCLLGARPTPLCGARPGNPGHRRRGPLNPIADAPCRSKIRHRDQSSKARCHGGQSDRKQDSAKVWGRLTAYVAPQGVAHVGRLASALEDPGSGLPGAVRALGRVLLGQIADLDAKIGGLEKELRACARQDEQAARLMTMPGVGPISAMALQAFAPPMESFRRGRDFSAWLGLVPRQHTTGGKPRLGRIRADPDEEARRTEERRALQGLAVAQRARSPADPARLPTTTATGSSSRSSRRCWRTGWRRSRRPAPRRLPAAPAAPTSCSTSWPGSASRRRRRASRRPKACGFATSRWPIVGATTA